MRNLPLVLWLCAAAGSASALPTIPGNFQHEGPQPIDTLEGNSPRVVAGAIEAVVVEPGHGNVVYIGAVNGGVWKTTDFRPGETSHAPVWKHLTDHKASLSISALSLDARDKSNQTLVAAIGTTSSKGANAGGPLTGILRTTDGGKTWDELGKADLTGRDLTGVVARGNDIAVAAASGVWFSNDTGVTFTRVAGTGNATSLVGDPQHPGDYWLASVGTGGGIFRGRVSGGALTFTQVGSAQVSNAAVNAKRIKLSVQSYGPDVIEVYAGVLLPAPDDAHKHDPDADIGGIVRLSLRRPATQFVTDFFPPASLPPFETASQGKFSIVGDPTDVNTFFVGGDEGDLFRCFAPPGLVVRPFPICTPITDRRPPRTHTASGTAPHTDSRAMVFDGDHALLETDDGGIFLRTAPRTDHGDWFSRNGDLGIAEAYSCAFDANSKVIFCGLQDNGTVLQPAPGKTVWKQILNFDGGIVAAPPVLLCGGHPRTCDSNRYFSVSSLDTFTHDVCDSQNACFPLPADLFILGTNTMLECDTRADKSQCGDPNVTETTPFAANRFDPQRLAFATFGKAYESLDGGFSVSVLPGFSLLATATRAILAGGRRNGSDNKDVLYVGSDLGLFLRHTPGGDLAVTSWGPAEVQKNGKPMRIAVEPANWRSAWIITSNDELWHADDAETGPWSQVAGLGFAGGKSQNHLLSLAFVNTRNPWLAVGAADGLYVMPIAKPGDWSKLTGTLPNALVYDLAFDKDEDILLVTTLGRSVWTMQGVRTTLP